LGLGNGADERT